MRQRPQYTATMDAKLLAKLDLARGRIPRSQMIEEAVKAQLEHVENVSKMKESYAQEPSARERLVTG